MPNCCCATINGDGVTNVTFNSGDNLNLITTGTNFVTNLGALRTPNTGLTFDSSTGILSLTDSSGTLTTDFSSISPFWQIVSGGIQPLTSLSDPKILPNTNDTQDIGSSTLRWKDLYLGSKIDYSDALTFEKDGVESWRIHSDGNFGNVPVPLNTFHLNGSFRYVDGNEGVGKVMTSDANGVVSWQALAGGGANTLLGLSDTDSLVVNGGYLRWNAGGTSVEYVSTIDAAALTNLTSIDTADLTNGANFITSNTTHTGEVTGLSILTLDPTSISNKPLVTAIAGMELLVNDSGTLRKIDVSDVLGGGGGATNLGVANTTITTLDITSDTGTDATIPSANASVAGLMSAGDKAKFDLISVTQNVDLDTMESDISINNAKVTNFNHTGEVTGASALTVQPDLITNKTTVTPVSGDFVLIYDTSLTGLRKVDASNFIPDLVNYTAFNENRVLPASNEVVDANMTPDFSNFKASLLSSNSGGTRNINSPSPNHGDVGSTFRVELFNGVGGSTDFVFDSIFKDSNGNDIGTITLSNPLTRSTKFFKVAQDTPLTVTYVEISSAESDPIFSASPASNVIDSGAGSVLYLDDAGNYTSPPGSSGSTNLSISNITATTLDIESDTGANVTVPESTNSTAGLMSASNDAKLDFISVTQAIDLDTIDSNTDSLVSLSGVASGSNDLGTFTGTTISDNDTIKNALQTLETAVEAFVNDGNDTPITRGDAITGVSPTAVEVPSPISGDTASVYLTDGVFEKYSHNGTSWSLAFTVAADEANNLSYTASPTNGTVTSSTGSDAVLSLADATNAGLMTPGDFSKLLSISSGATANDTDANLRDRSTHTGTQLSSTISNFAATVRSTVLTGISFATNAAVVATDSILSAIGKLQAQITANKTEAISLHLVDGFEGTTYLGADEVYPSNIDEIRLVTDSGTLDFTIQINGTDVTGLVGITANSTKANTVATAANTTADGDTISIVTANDSSSVNPRITIKTTRI